MADPNDLNNDGDDALLLSKPWLALTELKVADMLVGWSEANDKLQDWNGVREMYQKHWKPQIQNISLNNYHFSGGNFSNIYFAMVSFVNANISNCDFHHSSLGNVNFTGGNLTATNFNGCVLGSSVLTSVNARLARFVDAKMSRVIASSGVFRSCDFTNADLRSANLTNADFANAKFVGADLRRVDFSNARLTDADFADAKLDGAKHLRFDGNNIRGTQFSSNIDEAWHHVRRAYTGTKFFFHLLLLTVFLGGMGLRAIMWLGVNKAQTAVVEASKRLDEAAAQASTTNPEVSVAISHAASELGKVTATFTDDIRTYQVWQVLLGLDRGLGPCLLAIMLLLYNAGRGWLTYTVGAMREEEERSGYAPYWKDYRLAWYIHFYAMRYLILLAGLSFAYHAYFWLTAKVVLPG